MKTVFSLLILAGIAFSQTPFRVAADSSSGTYNKMLGELIGVCASDQLNMVKAEGITGGAAGNLEALYNNRADAAFLHSDVYFANAQADPGYNRLKTLIALYPEPIHVVALRVSKTSKSGFSFGKQDFTSLADAKGFKVGASGGGVYTARILTGQGEGGFSVVPFDKGEQVLTALTNGEIALAIFVGAAPLPNLEHLSGSQYKLIPIGESISNRVHGVYREATINYHGLTNGPIKTMAPLATLLTRQFHTPEKIRIQVQTRRCFEQNLGKLQDDGSPNWLQVKAGDQGTLPWLDLPETSGESRKR